MPQVSFFVQTYGHEAFISECIESILGQNGSFDYEIIVVDDASKDNTAKIVRGINDSRIRLIENPTNLGCIATANIGYKEAKGDYCARIDGDDRYRPDYLEKVIPILENNANVGVVYGDIAMVDPKGNISSPEGCIAVQRKNRPPLGNELIPLLIKNYLPAPTTIGRAKIWQSFLPIPKSLHYLDYYMTTHAAHICDFGFVNKVLADYRIHPGNQHSRMILDKTGEQSTFEILKLAFERPEFKINKEQYRQEIEATHFLVYAENYFGAGMTAEARRCYLELYKRSPSSMLNLNILRRFFGSLVGKSFYNWIKGFLKN